MEIVLNGDFNFNSTVVTWHEHDGMVYGTPREGDAKDKRSFALLQEFTDDFFLSQMIGRPTRQKSVLQLFYTSDPDCIEEVEIVPLPGKKRWQ